MRAVICLHLFSRLYILRALLALDENTPYGRIAPRCASNCASSNPPLSLPSTLFGLPSGRPIFQFNANRLRVEQKKWPPSYKHAFFLYIRYAREHVFIYLYELLSYIYRGWKDSTEVASYFFSYFLPWCFLLEALFILDLDKDVDHVLSRVRKKKRIGVKKDSKLTVSKVHEIFADTWT